MLYDVVVSLNRSQKRAILLCIDVLLIGLAHLTSHALILGVSSISAYPQNLLIDLAAMLSTGVVLTVLLGLHKIKLNAYEMQGVIDSAFVAVVIVAAGLVTSLLLSGVRTPPHVYVVTGMLFLILSVMMRLMMRQVLLSIYHRGNPRIPILIYGAGQTGQQLASALATDDTVQPVALVDDDLRLQNLTIAGLRVHSSSAVEALVERHQVARIVLAMPSVSPSVRAQISKRLAPLGCELHVLPSFADLVADTGKTLRDTHRIDHNDLLGRENLEADLPGVSDTYQGRRILVTGAGGSIGAELCRQLIEHQPEHLILLDHGEHALFDIDRELRRSASGLTLTPVLGSVCDKALMREVMEDHGIDIVFHAAAYKHVPLVEGNALEGMHNNVLGTKCAADAAREAGVERFILVSTDKAVRPASAMGASKRLAEMAIQDLATRSERTRFSMVRFGNVLGSSGSVIPLFQEQIANGGPVTLTHADVTRYFMTIPEAVRLVLVAGSFTRGGDVFVLDMGKPVAVSKVARQMIEGAGLTVRDEDNPDGDIEIVVTGLRPGEKLHEELLIGSDMLTTPHPKILRAQESHLSEIEMANVLQSLRQVVETRDRAGLKAILTKWIEKPQSDEDRAARL
ncbi:polysaccharide biosynthesis protein [Roseovarius faecimaris]|uniref:Polysaccharide biosynthesis protein n=1 Tax=Roseovarius faecimaris TaxID=2494550 RepID=A0A6I6J180_9RHOB|nr:nucleoside-diphosphate sugar epimerase/dehydratase [Roseovarius faecimaris]QGX98528.1 polysaccharide biosynthesis protein [Roseovarius faecimaris]